MSFVGSFSNMLSTRIIVEKDHVEYPFVTPTVTDWLCHLLDVFFFCFLGLFYLLGQITFSYIVYQRFKLAFLLRWIISLELLRGVHTVYDNIIIK